MYSGERHLLGQVVKSGRVRGAKRRIRSLFFSFRKIKDLEGALRVGKGIDNIRLFFVYSLGARTSRPPHRTTA